jgi:hypothetical protein
MPAIIIGGVEMLLLVVGFVDMVVANGDTSTTLEEAISAASTSTFSHVDDG